MQTTFSNSFSYMNVSFKFHWNLFPWIRSATNQHWFRWWPGAEQAVSHYLNQWWTSLLMYICVTRLLFLCCRYWRPAMLLVWVSCWRGWLRLPKGPRRFGMRTAGGTEDGWHQKCPRWGSTRLIGFWDIWMKFLLSNFRAKFSYKGSWCFLLKCHQINVAELLLW